MSVSNRSDVEALIMYTMASGARMHAEMELSDDATFGLIARVKPGKRIEAGERIISIPYG